MKTQSQKPISGSVQIATKMNSRNILFYDGKCPVCAKEIKLLERFKNQQLALSDLHNLSDKELNELGKSKFDMIEVLHLRNQHGEWLVGLDATVAAWNHTAFGWLLRPLRWPLIGPLADRLYTIWAKRRMCKLDYV